jgi:D-alanyl-D-alanine carboxypeptidase/D-alanyl-D-alanine-endopeptidase (penicillin-binding protein 4)
MNPRITVALLAACAALACASPARAVDRSLGAGIAKPVAAGAQWTDAEIASLSANVDVLLAGAKTLGGAHVGIYAIGARDGRVLYARNADDLFQPASTLKLLVGSAALDKLGPGFRFTTEAFVPGSASVVDGEVKGSVMLRGGGDVLLDDAALAELPAALRAAGVVAVHGVSFIDDRRFPPYLPGWSWDDFPWYYAAPVTPLSLNDNTVTLDVTPGAGPGAPVSVAVRPWGTACIVAAPCRADLGFAIDVRATTGEKGSASTLDVTRDVPSGGLDRVTLIGSLAAGADAEHLDIAVPWPPRYAAAAATRALTRAGFRVLPDLSAAPPAAAPGNDRIVWTHNSAPLSDLLGDLWQPSDNILAEQLLRALGAPDGARQGPSAAGIAWEKTWLKKLGIDAETVALEDGSGLSVYDRITPHDLVTILKYDWDGANRDVVLDDLPLAGVRGTLKASFTGTAAEQHVFAKTGTLAHASALAGYAANAKHGAVIFAFTVDDWIGEAAALRELRGRVLSHFVED